MLERMFGAHKLEQSVVDTVLWHVRQTLEVAHCEIRSSTLQHIADGLNWLRRLTCKTVGIVTQEANDRLHF